jgi:hypothetical protein
MLIDRPSEDAVLGLARSEEQALYPDDWPPSVGQPPGPLCGGARSHRCLARRPGGVGSGSPDHLHPGHPVPGRAPLRRRAFPPPQHLGLPGRPVAAGLVERRAGLTDQFVNPWMPRLSYHARQWQLRFQRQRYPTSPVGARCFELAVPLAKASPNGR